jgi:hypothetical protein
MLSSGTFVSIPECQAMDVIAINAEFARATDYHGKV